MFNCSLTQKTTTKPPISSMCPSVKVLYHFPSFLSDILEKRLHHSYLLTSQSLLTAHSLAAYTSTLLKPHVKVY